MRDNMLGTSRVTRLDVTSSMPEDLLYDTGPEWLGLVRIVCCYGGFPGISKYGTPITLYAHLVQVEIP